MYKYLNIIGYSVLLTIYSIIIIYNIHACSCRSRQINLTRYTCGTGVGCSRERPSPWEYVTGESASGRTEVFFFFFDFFTHSHIRILTSWKKRQTTLPVMGKSASATGSRYTPRRRKTSVVTFPSFGFVLLL